MTVYIEKPAVNLREELASLRNQGGYQEQQFYFDGLVTNGTFDTDTDWTKSEFSISGGVAVPNSSATTCTLSQDNLGMVNGGTYILEFDVSGRTAGNIYPRAGSYSNLATLSSTANGTHTYTFVSSDDLIQLVTNVGFDGVIDNVSVFEVDANDDVIHTMPKGWKPKDVFEDGLLQREGAAHDYEVVYDGFDYIIKPTVAPSAITQTCVIGVKA